MKRIAIGENVTLEKDVKRHQRSLLKGDVITRVCTKERRILDRKGNPEKGMWFTKTGEDGIFKLSFKDFKL